MKNEKYSAEKKKIQSIFFSIFLSATFLLWRISLKTLDPKKRLPVTGYTSLYPSSFDREAYKIISYHIWSNDFCGVLYDCIILLTIRWYDIVYLFDISSFLLLNVVQLYSIVYCILLSYCIFAFVFCRTNCMITILNLRANAYWLFVGKDYYYISIYL